MMLSGGLDSTFVAASLAHRAAAQPVRCYIATPLRDATDPADGRAFDETPLVRLLASHYPGLLEIEEVQNDELVLPLDAATDQTSETWWPTYAVANLVWLRKIEGLAADRGSLGILNGGHGNAAFSYSHSYAARFLLKRHDWRGLRGLATPADSQPSDLPRLVKQRIIATLRRPPNVGLSTRPAYLRWLACHSTPHPAGRAPVAGRPLAADPFSSRAVLDFAASMTPVEWNRSALTRGYARMLGAGRIPDPIRLRTQRGSQASDVWHWMHHSRERYLDELRAIPNTSIAADALDTGKLIAIASNWAWGDAMSPPPRGEIFVVDQALAFSAFCRDTTMRLRRLNRDHAH